MNVYTYVIGHSYESRIVRIAATKEEVARVVLFERLEELNTYAGILRSWHWIIEEFCDKPEPITDGMIIGEE